MSVTYNDNIILLTWFAASWYLFRLMQRLLFGPHRNDLRYDDLKSGEMAAFGVVLVLLFLLTIAPHAWLKAEVNELARRIVEIP